MTRVDHRTKVLAVGLDGAEATLVQALLAEGLLPGLAGLLKGGRWSRIDSQNRIGSATVWPSFMTGEAPSAHGIYNEVMWRPQTMGVARVSTRELTPFWAQLRARGLRVGVLDVPYAPLVGLEDGFEIFEWGAHDVVEGRTHAGPAGVAELVSQMAPHPYKPPQPDLRGPDDRHGAERVAASSHEGIRRRGELAERLLAQHRPDLAIVLFPELHHAGHHLWHTVAGDHPMYSGVDLGLPLRGPSLPDLYRAVDTEVERLTSVVGPDCSVVVFAPHGMRPGWGFPTVLPALLEADRFAQRPLWTAQTWRERAAALLGLAKRHSPSFVRETYRSHAPRSVRLTVARPNLLAPHDWSHTTAFSLPTDHHGYMRVNLAGRERLGLVPEHEYPMLCDAVEARLRGLTTVAGDEVVADVVRPAPTSDEARRSPLPDLIVHWSMAAYVDPLDVGDGVGRTSPQGRHRSGNHSDTGFCVATGRAAELLSDAVAVEALARVLVGALGLDS
jgi:predicted AlkP superfamily phosphohydrolase/phosphomutase